MYLKAQGLAQKNQKKQKRRKWVRYEREHSLSAGHIDWHEVDGTGIKVCVILDDASRMVLAGGEFSAINTENSKLVIDQLVEKYWWLCPMRELILDHGSEFGAHRIHDDGSWKSDFKNHLEKYGIRPILARVKHPQTNGKLERFFGIKDGSDIVSLDNRPWPVLCRPPLEGSGVVFRERSDPVGSDPRHGVRGSRCRANPLDSLGLGRVQHLRRLSGGGRQPWDNCPLAAQKFGRQGGGATKSRNSRGANFRRGENDGMRRKQGEMRGDTGEDRAGRGRLAIRRDFS
jgi:transposase InsO family protein